MQCASGATHSRTSSAISSEQHAAVCTSPPPNTATCRSVNSPAARTASKYRACRALILTCTGHCIAGMAPTAPACSRHPHRVALCSCRHPQSLGQVQAPSRSRRAPRSRMSICGSSLSSSHAPGSRPERSSMSYPVSDVNTPSVTTKPGHPRGPPHHAPPHAREAARPASATSTNGSGKAHEPARPPSRPCPRIGCFLRRVARASPPWRTHAPSPPPVCPPVPPALRARPPTPPRAGAHPHERVACLFAPTFLEIRVLGPRGASPR